MNFSFKKKPKKKEHKVLRKRKVRKPLSTLQLQLIVGIVLAIIIALIVTGIYYATRIDSLQIKHVEVIGGQTIPHNVIEQKVNDALSGAYLKLIPKRFIPMYPQKDIVQSIKQLDRIKDLKVSMTNDQTLAVVFDEYIPYALWCEKDDSPSCMFIDAQGYAFAQAPDLDGSAFVRFVDSDIVPQKNATAFDKGFMDNTKEFIEMLKDELSLYVIGVNRIGTYDVDYTLSGGGVVKASQSMNIQDTFDNLKTILRSDQFSHIAPGTFQYIDLRFGDKVFVNDSAPTASSSVDTLGTSTSPQ